MSSLALRLSCSHQCCLCTSSMSLLALLKQGGQTIIVLRVSSAQPWRYEYYQALPSHSGAGCLPNHRLSRSLQFHLLPRCRDPPGCDQSAARVFHCSTPIDVLHIFPSHRRSIVHSRDDTCRQRSSVVLRPQAHRPSPWLRWHLSPGSTNGGPAVRKAQVSSSTALQLAACRGGY
jgi:hypothetical protein